jgi:hypothetical protein
MRNFTLPVHSTGLFRNNKKYVLSCFLLLISIFAWPGNNSDKNFVVAFSQHPAPASACDGSSASFAVVATGSGTLSYQWQESTNGGNTYNNISSGGIYSGATAATLVITNVTAGMNNFRYRCVVTDGSGPATSNHAVLTINPGPTVQTGNAGHTICAAGGGTLTAQFFSGQTYQWQVSTDIGSTWNDVVDGGSYSGSATDVLFITNAASLDGVLYRYIATATSSGCKDTSGIDTLHVLQPIINNQPIAATVCVGGGATYTVAANSPVALTYQWQLGASNLSNNSTYSGVTTPTLTISNITAAMDRQLYRVAVRDTLLCLTNSNQVRLFVIAPPVINTQPQDATICAGLNTSFSVAATSATVSGTAARTYQWETDNGTNGITWSNITTGGTSATISLTGVTMAMNGYRYRVTVSTGSCGSVTSSSATLTVRSSGTWLGAVDTNWHVAGNWCGGVPVSTTDVLIPNWAPRMPTISNTTGIAYSRNLVIENNAKLTINGGSTSMSGPFNILGTVAYTAEADQPVLPADHGSLEINGSGNKILQLNTGISNNMALGGTAKLVTNNHILTMRAGSNPVSGATFSGAVTSWIVTGNGSSGAVNTGLGGLRFEQVNASKGIILFPVGPTSAAYNPALLSNTGVADDITMAVNDQVIPGGIVNSGIDRTWIITEATPGGSSVTLELAWTAPEEESMFNRAQSEIIRSNGTSIIEHSATDSAAGLNPYSRQEDAFTALTQFSVASYISVGVLPVKIKSFAATRMDNASARLLWEIGGDYEAAIHTIQRSADGIHFTNIGAVNGQPGKTLYAFTDERFNDKTSWYRLQIMTSDGKAMYSHIAKVIGQDNKARIELRPSITQNQTTILFIVAARKERSVVRLLDMSGKVVSQNSYELEKGENNIPLRIDHLQKGVYYLHIVVNTEKAAVVRLIKQ